MQEIINGSINFVDVRGVGRVIVGPIALAAMFHLAAEAGETETGGILIGKYSEDASAATVEEATAAPRDSVASRVSFVRGTAGLRSHLRKVWKKGLYYVGEWHSHPGGSAAPSATDMAAIAEIAGAATMRCKNPILMVVGAGDILHVSTLRAGPLRRSPKELETV